MSLSKALDEVLDLASYRLAQLKNSNDSRNIPEAEKAQIAYDMVRDLSVKVELMEAHLNKQQARAMTAKYQLESQNIFQEFKALDS